MGGFWPVSQRVAECPHAAPGSKQPAHIAAHRHQVSAPLTNSNHHRIKDIRHFRGAFLKRGLVLPAPNSSSPCGKLQLPEGEDPRRAALMRTWGCFGEKISRRLCVNKGSFLLLDSVKRIRE